MKRLITIALFAFTAIILASCEKNPSMDVDGGLRGPKFNYVVEIYMLKSFTTNSGQQIIDSSVVLLPTPLINYSDITYYNKSTCTFGLTEEGKRKLSKLQVPVGGVPFGVAVDKCLIYTGYFWPAHFSSLCNWVYTDPIMGEYSGELAIKLGTVTDNNVIPDKRNNEAILYIMAKHNKLRE
ncbi:MAG: hypothetical protein PHT25_10145 [Bacteroidales bacterium]|nr:hypothetical protein [Bacteroidales bacterium]